MPSYTLEIEAFGVYSTDIPTLEIWEDGVLDSSHAISSTGTSIIVTINYPGALPSSLEFRFNDALPEGGRTIEIQSVKINDKYVNTGNYLSIDSLTNGGAAGVVDVANSSFIYDSSEPSAATFTPVTTALTAGNDTFRRYDGADYTLDGLAGRDNIYLGAGNDTVTGGAGNDLLRGGAGNDLLYGAGDDDRVHGEGGDDLLYGGSGNDRVYGGTGDDEIHGNDGDDRLFGHAGSDVITGGIGNDVIVGGGTGADSNYLFGDDGNDTIIGGQGNDTLDGGNDDDLIYGGGGDDILEGGDGIDILIGDAGDDRIDGNDGNDELYGRDDDDELNGNDGDDELNGGLGVDTIDGGADNDTINLSNGDFAAGESLTGGTGTDGIVLLDATTVDFRTGTLATLETITGSADADTITLSTTQFVDFTTIDLDGGADVMNVSIVGTDDISGSGLPTVTNTEIGNLIGSTGADDLTITGAQVNAIINGTGTIDFNTGADILNLTSTSTDLNTLGNTDASIQGLESISVAAAAAGVTVLLLGQTEDFTVTGSGFNDIIATGAGTDVLNMGAGNDIFAGLGGADTLDGGAGNDNIILLAGDFVAGESITGGTGTDTITFNNAQTTDFTVGTLTTVELLTGSGGNDTATMSATQFVGFTTINLAGGTDVLNVSANGTEDISASGLPTVTNTETGNLVGSTGADDLTITGAQLNAILIGAGTIDFDTGADVLNITSTSTDLNTLGATDASITGLEEINASSAGAGVTIDLSGQTENFIVTGSANNDTIDTGSGDDTINGGNGDDTITAGAGSDTIDGGANNDEIILSSGDFIAGESITGGTGTDTITFNNAQTTDFTVGALATVELLDGSTGNDTVTMSATQFVGFTTIDMAAGTDILNVSVSGTVDISASGTPTVNNTETGNLVGSAGADDLTITGGQLNAILNGTGTISFAGGTDVLNLTSTSADLNTLGVTDGSITGLEEINASSAGAGVTIDLSGQTEDLIVTGSANNDTIDTGSGDDTINGGNGNDTISGGAGSDTINGGDGDDTIYATDSSTSGNIRNSLSTEILSDNPVLYYKMNETSGTTITNYGSLGSAVDGTLSGTYTLDDTDQYLVSGSAVDFEGSSRIAVPDSTSINTAAHTVRSVELVFTADSTTGRQVLYEEGGNTNAFVMYLDGANIYFNARDAGEYGPFTITTGITLGQTYHAAFTFDSVTTNLFTGYLDGVVVGTGVTNTDMDSHGGDIGIGNVNGSAYMHDGTSSGNYFFDGRISDVAIYNSVLSAADLTERAAIVNETAATDTNTIDDGDGLDTLYASDEAEIFVFDSANATNDTDVIEYFSAGHGDQLDISDLLTGFVLGTSDINDFVQLTEAAGNTTIAIDSNGTTGGASFSDIAVINGVTGMDADMMLINEVLIT